MTLTLNKWTALTKAPPYQVTAPNGASPRFATRSVAWIMHYCVWQWDRRIENVTQFGGYRSPSLQERINPLALTSNHTSGTATDTNWLLHPYEVNMPKYGWRSGFTSAQMTQLRQILSECRAPNGDIIVRWGGDFRPASRLYRGRRDGMHLEIARTVGYGSAHVKDSEVTSAVNRIRNEILGTQKAVGVRADGLWGMKTQAALVEARKTKGYTRTLALQRAWRISADGKWGPDTEARFQRNVRRFYRFVPWDLT